VLRLNKALYGTKQAARCWWRHLTNILVDIGFEPNKEDLSTYTYLSSSGTALLWIHVDDGALTASLPQLLEEIVKAISRRLKIKWDKKVTILVGLNIHQSAEGIRITQSDLIQKLITLCPRNITAKSPLPLNCKLESGPSKEMDIPYLQRIGMLLHIAQGSRPDITFAVNYLARFLLGTTEDHWKALEHLIAYLRMTDTTGVMIRDSGSTSAFECYVDANWGGEGNRSTHGFLLLHNNNPISWQSKRQATIASLTCQAEYMAMSFAARECLWISRLFQPILGISIPRLYSDNKTSVNITLNIASQKQTRHLIREFNLVNEYIAKGKISLSWISTHAQMADILTKPLGSLKVTQFLSLLNSIKVNVTSRGGECYDSSKNQKKFLEHSET
ncbi:hypothetical protein O181_076151, partial [Austropuccinia psidii MF-1]|nr:hypothetical protein [Austropuccinia psidii MF-1]